MSSSRRRGRAAALLALILALALPAAAGAAAVPKRIVALTPFAANTLARLDVKPIAIGQTLGGNERYSPKLKGVAVLPLSHPNGPNLEQLVSLKPDLVISAPVWAKGNQSMAGLGLRVVNREPLAVRSAFAQMISIGRLVGKAGEARLLVKAMKKAVARARRGITERPKVMLILGVGRSPFTFLPNSWGGDLVTKAGGELMTGGVNSSSGFERISDEVVVAENPDVIIAVPHANASDIPSLTEYLKSNPAWAATAAAQNDRVYISNDNSLLQAGTDVAQTIRKVRIRYLHNWPEG